MATNINALKNRWLNIYLLVNPYQKRVLLIFTICLLSTALMLMEALIYREAVNDITGLFVQKARNGSKVAEEGTPAQLIEQGGWFADFARAGENE